MAAYGTVIFDCDSTLSAIEGIDELAGARREAIARLTDAAMRGDVRLEQVYGRRLEIIATTRPQVEALGDLYVSRLVPGARETIAALRNGGVQVRIISGGLLPPVLALARELGLGSADVAAVDIAFDARGMYVDYDRESPLARSHGKLEVIRAWRAALPLPLLFVGDGITDLEAKEAVECFVAFTGVVKRAAVVAGADYVISGPSLLPVLRLVFPAGEAEHDDLRPVQPERRFSSGKTLRRAAKMGDRHIQSKPGRSGESLAFGRFFLPGPTELRPEILEAMMRPMIGHRGRAMEELLAQMQPSLQRLFRTRRLVYVASSSATGLMEGAVRNGARRRVLALVNGAFSERFRRIALACGIEADELGVPLGAAHTPDMLETALRRAEYDAITIVHSETSTGVLNPLADLALVARAAGDVAVLVDSVTGLGGTPVETDAWGLDVVLTGSQKALALPPGLALGVASERVLERARLKTHRGVYFDFLEFEKYTAQNQTPNTPALSLFFALAAQLERIEAETLEGRWQRHLAMARRTWLWVDEMRERGLDLSMLAPPGYRSPTVSCVRLPAGTTGPAVTNAMKQRGFTIATGYGPLKDESIRIGHMGDHTVDELEELLEELERVLRS